MTALVQPGHDDDESKTSDGEDSNECDKKCLLSDHPAKTGIFSSASVSTCLFGSQN